MPALATQELEVVADQVLDSKVLKPGDPVPSIASWKPKQSVPRELLQQWAQHLPVGDRLPLTALWWEHQGHLDKAVKSLETGKAGDPWLCIAWVEAILVSKTSAKEIGLAIDEIERIGPKAQGMDLAACFCAKAHVLVKSGKLQEAQDAFKRAEQGLKAEVANDTSATLAKSWKYRAVQIRMAAVRALFLPSATKLSPLEQAANWILDAPLPREGVASAKAWKPGEPIFARDLARIEQSLPEIDHPTLTALWWERQNSLDKAVALFQGASSSAWHAATHAESLLSGKVDASEIDQAKLLLDKAPPPRDAVEQAVLRSASAHQKMALKEFDAARIELNASQEILGKEPAGRREWRWRVVNSRNTKLLKDMAEGLATMADKMWEQACQEKKKGNWLVAAKNFHRLAEGWPKHASADAARFESGCCLLKGGQGDMAERELQVFIDANPAGSMRGQAQLLLAERDLFIRDKPDCAADRYAKVIAVQAADKSWDEPRDVALIRGGALLQKKCVDGKACDEAAMLFRLYLQRHPYSPVADAMGAKGIPNSVGDLIKGAACGKNPLNGRDPLTEYGPVSVRWSLWLSAYELSAERVASSRALLQDVMAHPKATADQKAYAICEFAESFRMEGKSDEAEKLFDEVLKKYPISEVTAWATLQKAYLLVNRGDEKNACKLLEYCAGKFPRTKEASEALYVRGWIAYTRNQKEDAKKAYASLLFRYPESVQAKHFKTTDWYRELCTSNKER